MKNPYFPTALGLYFNYLVHGMDVILMSLNMASLETLWHTNAAGVSVGLCIQLVEHVFFDKRSDHFFVDLN